jgi:hypothetical protein
VREIVARWRGSWKGKSGIFYKVWFKKKLKKHATWEYKADLVEDGLIDYINAYEEKIKKRK